MKCSPETQILMAEYLLDRVDVSVEKQNEVPEVPEWAVYVNKDPSFWIGCWETKEEAVRQAADLGLIVHT